MAERVDALALALTVIEHPSSQRANSNGARRTAATAEVEKASEQMKPTSIPSRKVLEGFTGSHPTAAGAADLPGMDEMPRSGDTTAVGRPLNVVLVGCGEISHAWLKPTLARRDLRFVGFVDLRMDAAVERAGEYGLDIATGTDLQAMLKKTTPDVVFDCSVPEAHAGVTLAALNHGCHVLGEKPMADSMDSARAIVNAAKESGRVYAVIQNRRYMPGIRAVRDFLRTGTLGAITTVQSNFFIGAHFGGFRKEMDHVLLLDMAIHTFDAARYVIGADSETVYCHEWNPSGSWYRHGASAVAVFRMARGIVYTYQGSWCAEGVNTSWEADWHTICENGSLRWNGGNEIRAEGVTKTGGFASETEEVSVPVPEMDDDATGHGGVIADFVAAVQSGGEPLTVCTDNIKSLAMVHGAIESAESGRQLPVGALGDQ